MDDATFLNDYADARLRAWWGSAPVLRLRMLDLLTVVHQTPLIQLDQFTVGLYTDTPDGWAGPRLVFAIRNNTAPNSRATPHTFRMALALNPAKITACLSPCLAMGGQGQNVRWALSEDKILPFLRENQERIRLSVDEAMNLRRINGRLVQRIAHKPSNYDLG